MPEGFVACLVLLNLVSFVLCGLDKHFAKTKKYRISEKTLLLWGALFGSLGLIMGMVVFRHKTRHIKFVIAAPVFFVVHVIVMALVFGYGVF